MSKPKLVNNPFKDAETLKNTIISLEDQGYDAGAILDILTEYVQTMKKGRGKWAKSQNVH